MSSTTFISVVLSLLTSTSRHNTTMLSDLSDHDQLIDELPDVIVGCQQVDTWPDVLDETGPRDDRAAAQYTAPFWKRGDGWVEQPDLSWQVLSSKTTITTTSTVTHIPSLVANVIHSEQPSAGYDYTPWYDHFAIEEITPKWIRIGFVNS